MWAARREETALMVVQNSGAHEDYAKAVTEHINYIFPWRLMESLARSKAEQSGKSYLTNEAQAAVLRFLELEKEGELGG